MPRRMDTCVLNKQYLSDGYVRSFLPEQEQLVRRRFVGWLAGWQERSHFHEDVQSVGRNQLPTCQDDVEVFGFYRKTVGPI